MTERARINPPAANDEAADNIDLALLPGALREIAELIGLPAALTLSRVYGGRRLYVPRRYDPEHPLVKLLGHQAAIRLIDNYGGLEHFDVPMAASLTRELRNRAIRRDRARGDSCSTLARRYQMTERTIWTILAQSTAEDAPRQAALF